MYEYGPDDECRHWNPYEWYTRSIPGMENPDERARLRGPERPLHVHPAGDPAGALVAAKAIRQAKVAGGSGCNCK